MKRFLKKEKTYLLFILPAMLFMVVFLFYPLARGIPIAFTDWDGFSPTSKFVGFKNFARIFRDLNIPRDIGNTLLFTLLETFFCNVIGLTMAMAVKKASRVNNTLRTAFFMPYVISLVLSSYMVQYLLYQVCQAMGWSSPLAVQSRVIYGLSMIAIWRDSGYCMVIFIAAILSVDQAMYESASIEGASSFYQFRKITLPMIVPAFTANVTLLLSWGLKLFDYSMTAVKGDASESINVYVYRLIFPGYRAGYGQSIAVVWLIIVFVITNLVSGLLRRQEVDL